MGSVMVSLYNIPPGPKDTSSPKRWASRVRSTSSWISPISCKWICPRVSFHTTWSWGSSCSKRRSSVQCGVGVGAFRQQDLIAQHRFQGGGLAVPLGAQTLAGAALGQAGDCADLPRPDPLGQGIFCAGVQPQLIGFFGPGTLRPLAGEQVLYL